MMFKNSIKLLCANFDKVWKLLVYQILSWAVVFALLAPFYHVISTEIVNAWNSYEIGKYFTSGTFYGINISAALSAICYGIISFVTSIFNANVWIGIYMMIIIFVVKPLFSNVGKYVVCEMTYGYMAASSKHSFTGTFLRTLNKSLPYAAMKTMYSWIFDALVLLSMFGLTAITNPLYGYAMPFLVVLVPSILLAFKETFVAGWAPAMVVFDVNVFKAFPKGMAASLRRGLRVFSNAFIIYLLAFVLSAVLGVYALIIILPIIFPLFDIFEMVMFFSSQGMRFYVDNDTILTPKKLEEVDKIDDAKFLL